MAAALTVAQHAAAVEAALADEAAYRRFGEFCPRLWPEAVPSAPCVWAPHMGVICDEIQAIIEESDRRRKRAAEILATLPPALAAQAIESELGVLPKLRLVILVPPRHSKSAIVSKLLPPWRWLHRPEEQILTLTSADTLIERDGIAVRDVVRCRAYQTMQARLVKSHRLLQDPNLAPGQAFGLRPDQFAKDKFQNTRGGGRAGHPLGAGYTGVDADIAIIDDPHDIDDAFLGTPTAIVARMQEVRDTYKDKVQDRLNSPIWGVVILIMQRVHPHDLAAYMIDEGAKVVCLPAEFMPDHPLRYEKDWRREAGEPLNPLRFPRSVLAAKRQESPHGYATKWMLLPTLREGGRYQRSWFGQTYAGAPTEIALDLEEILISVDAANKEKAENDCTAIHVWGRRGADRYLLDRVTRRMEFVALYDAFTEVCRRWPQAAFKLIEDKANGTALISAAKKDGITGVVPVEPGRMGKEARSAFAEASAEAGQVWLPSREFAPWVDAFVEEVVSFRAGGKHDDDVDAMSQAFRHWAEGTVSPWLTPERRAALSRAAPSVQTNEHTTRWGVRDKAATYWMAIVPGWAEGHQDGEAVAVIVDARGVMVSVVEVNGGGPRAFAEAVSTEAAYWKPEPARYAELAGRPHAEMRRVLSHEGVRVASLTTKVPGQPGSGWVPSPKAWAAVWADFLVAITDGMVGVPDRSTMRTLSAVVEVEGLPTNADKTPINGRLLALLLASSQATARRRAEQPAKKERFTFVKEAPKDIWSATARVR